MSHQALPPKAAYDRAAIAYHDALQLIQQGQKDGQLTAFAAMLRYDWLREEYRKMARPEARLAICQAVIQMCEDDYKRTSHV